MSHRCIAGYTGPELGIEEQIAAIDGEGCGEKVTTPRARNGNAGEGYVADRWALPITGAQVTHGTSTGSEQRKHNRE